ncbi:MAG TPA: TMEM175 family protein [Candidatus Sulfotelmatobacter sp.]|nr:TMEM175 family protein [Candidatus Sulfotelmatobacter sp.]
MYRESLSHEERHLSTRLESFGDIVFGFSLSLSALQLSVPTHASDLGDHPIRWLLYGVTFALLVTYWLRYHRIMSVGFRPQQIDRTMLFAYLASISLLPYGLITFSRLMDGTALDEKAGFMFYALLVFAIAATGLVLEWRGLRRSYAVLDGALRERVWRAVVRSSLSAVIFALAIAIDAVNGVHWAWVPLVALPFANRLGGSRLRAIPERLFGRGTSAPSGVS